MGTRGRRRSPKPRLVSALFPCAVAAVVVSAGGVALAEVPGLTAGVDAVPVQAEPARDGSARAEVQQATWSQLDADLERQLEAARLATEAEAAAQAERQARREQLHQAALAAAAMREAAEAEAAAREAEAAAREAKAREKAEREAARAAVLAREDELARRRAAEPDPHAGTSRSRAAMQEHARQVMGEKYGWSGAQAECVIKLWDKESRWRWDAENAASGAYGIPQSLPAKKMESAGSDWKTNPQTQIAWGLDYIKSRYGTPCAAWEHSIDNNWY